MRRYGIKRKRTTYRQGAVKRARLAFRRRRRFPTTTRRTGGRRRRSKIYNSVITYVHKQPPVGITLDATGQFKGFLNYDQTNLGDRTPLTHYQGMFDETQYKCVKKETWLR